MYGILVFTVFGRKGVELPTHLITEAARDDVGSGVYYKRVKSINIYAHSSIERHARTCTRDELERKKQHFPTSSVYRNAVRFEHVDCSADEGGDGNNGYGNPFVSFGFQWLR